MATETEIEAVAAALMKRWIDQANAERYTLDHGWQSTGVEPEEYDIDDPPDGMESAARWDAETAIAALDRVRAEDRDALHDAYVEPLDGGHRGYQARCWVCDWTGPEHLRGDETLGTWASRAHKAAARTDAAEHRAEFSDGATADGKGNDA